MMLDLSNSIIEPYGTLPAWLGARSTFVGASESPLLFGLGYANQSLFRLGLDKLGQRESDDEETEQMECGNEFQEPILRMFTRRSGIPVKDHGRYTVIRAKSRPHIACTLDGSAANNENATIEAKFVVHYNGRDWRDDDLPLRVQIQCQHQIFCTSAERSYAVALVDGRLTWKLVERHERFIAALVERLDAFWADIHAGKLPEIDGSAATTEALKSLYRATSGETIELPPELQRWDDKLGEARDAIKHYESVKSEAENRIRAALGTAVIGRLPNGVEYHSPVTVVNHAVREAYTSEYRALRRKEPKQ